MSPLYGPVEVPFDLNGKQVKFPVFIADIPDDCLIGADFLSTFQCYISMKEYTLQLALPDGSTIMLRCNGFSPSTESRRLVRTIRTTKAIQVQARE